MWPPRRREDLDPGIVVRRRARDGRRDRGWGGYIARHYAGAVDEAGEQLVVGADGVACVLGEVGVVLRPGFGVAGLGLVVEEDEGR